LGDSTRGHGNATAGPTERGVRRYPSTASLLIAATVPTAGILGLALLAISLGQSAVGLGLMIAAASFTVGVLLGFLFGIPRSTGTERVNDGQVAAKYSVNTNLEQISDWLTKILVGVGLIQLGKLGAASDDLVNAVGSAFTPGPVGRVAAGSLLTLFLISGFLFGYVATRTVLGHMFVQFDPQSLDSLVEDHVSKLEYQDSWALRAIIDQLDEDRPPVEFGVLKGALENASRLYRGSYSRGLGRLVDRSAWVRSGSVAGGGCCGGQVGAGSGGSQGPVVKSWVSASRASMPCLAAVDR
jgi:hypothetical protein